jgi:cysteine-rich repeat protein
MRNAFVFSILCSLLLIPTAQAIKFVDTVHHPHELYIDVLADHGIVEGYGYGIFRPDQPINRAEFLKILMLAVYGDEAREVYNPRCFGDFLGQQQWFWAIACSAKERGIIGGYPDGTFQGEQTVNLAEAMKMATLAWNIPVQSGQYAPEYWYIPYFEIAAARGLFEYFPRNGGHLLTRSDMAYLIVSMDEPIQRITPSSSSSSSTAAVNPLCGNGTLEAPEQCDDGNVLNDDGCSSICVIVPEPTYHGALRIEQRSTNVQTLAPGMKNVTLLVFDAIAGRQDVTVTHLSFRAFTGSLTNASNYRIYADVDGNGTAEQLVGSSSPDSGAVTFGSLSIVVPDGIGVRVELVADINETVSSGGFGVEFSLNDPRFVQGVGVADNRDLTGIEIDGTPCTESSICWIAVHTLDIDPFEIRARGNLYINADSTPVRSRILVGGSTSPDLLRLRFQATGEAVEVTNLRIVADEGVFTQLQLLKEGQSSPEETLTAAACSPVVSNHFCANASFTIPQNGEVVYVVRGTVKSDAQGLDSGDEVTLRLDADPVKWPVEARGVSSKDDFSLNDGDSSEDGEVFIGRSIPGSDQDVLGPTHDVAFANILSITNASDDPNQSPVPTGTATFGKFQFTAAENANTQDGPDSVFLQTLVFNINATNVQFLADSFKLFNADDASILHDCTSTGVTGQITVTCSGLDSTEVNTEIESDGSITLGLRGFVVNPKVQQGNSVLQASLQSLGNRNSGGTVLWADSAASFDWVDLEVPSVASTTYVQ